MKKIKKGLLFLPLVAMGVSLFAGLSSNKKVEKVSAEEEYSIIDVEVERVYTKWGWLTFSFDTSNGGTFQESPSFAFTDFNTKTSPYLNGDSTIPAFDPTTNIAGFYIGGDANSFWSSPNPAFSDNRLKAVSSITIPAGTEFPSRGTVAGTEKVKYVVKTATTFYNLSWSATLDYDMTKDTNVNFVDSDVVAFSNSNPNPSWPAFKLSVNDYSSKANASVINNACIYNYLYNVNKVTNTSRDGKVYNFFTPTMNLAYTNFDDSSIDYISFCTTYTSWGNDFLHYKVIYIPKGTIFPSWQWQTNVSNYAAQKTLYRTTKDVIYYCTSQWGNVFTKAEPTFVDATISNVAGLASFDQGGTPYTNFSFFVDGFDSTACNSNTPAYWSLCNLFSNADFYANNVSVDVANGSAVNYIYGAQFVNLSGSTNYLMQIQTDALSSVDKIVFHKGAMFPTPAFLAGTSNNWYILPEDQTLVCFSGQWGALKVIDNFVDTYMKLDTVATNIPGTGECISEGWYAAAKAAYNALPYGDKIVFFNNARYSNASTRLIQWAIANGESLHPDATLAADASINPTITTNNSLVMIIVAISMVSLLGIASILAYKKRKEEK